MKKVLPRGIHKRRTGLENRGAVTVEYALGMMAAAFFMLGVFSLFEGMSLRIINEFKQFVLSFPNI